MAGVAGSNPATRIKLFTKMDIEAILFILFVAVSAFLLATHMTGGSFVASIIHSLFGR